MKKKMGLMAALVIAGTLVPGVETKAERNFGEDVAFLRKHVKVIVLTVEDSDDEIRAAVDAGVDGYLLKSSDSDQISHAIGMVLQDAGAFPPAVVQKLTRASGEDPLARLSVRELEIAEYVAQGFSNKVIGGKLNLSDNTVRNHLANIMQKLNFHNRVQVATLVLQHLKKSKRF